MKKLFLYAFVAAFHLCTVNASEPDLQARPAINELPNEMLMEIFSFLDDKSAHSSRLVCQDWNRLINDQTFDLQNKHLKLPYYKTCIKGAIFMLAVKRYNDLSPIEVIDQYWFQRAKNNLAKDFRSSILHWPHGKYRALGYRALFDLFPWGENLILAYHYTINENESAAKKLLDRYIKDGKCQDYKTCIESIKAYEQTISGESNRPKYHPFEEELLSQEYWKKARTRCCQIHQQFVKIAKIAKPLLAIYLVYTFIRS